MWVTTLKLGDRVDIGGTFEVTVTGVNQKKIDMRYMLNGVNTHVELPTGTRINLNGDIKLKVFPKEDQRHNKTFRIGFIVPKGIKCQKNQTTRSHHSVTQN